MNPIAKTEVDKLIRTLDLKIDVSLPDDELKNMFIDSVDWIDISSEYQLSEYFMREFLNNLDKDLICEYQQLSQNFMADFEEILNWKKISEFQTKTMTWKFMMRYKNQLQWVKMPRDKGYRGIY